MEAFKIWTEQELLRICDQHGSESLLLEFKRAATIDEKDTQAIAQVVSAFANTGGGQIIFGLQSDKADRAQALDSGWNSTDRKKDWISDIILSHVTPKIDFEVAPIQLTSGRELYVVNVRQGNTAYQAKDGKFYRRRDAKNEPMNWFEIEDVKSRKTRPDLDVTIAVVPNNVHIKPHISASSTNPVGIWFAVTNKSPTFVQYLQLHVWFHELVWWDPAQDVIAPWEPQSHEDLPNELRAFEAFHKRSGSFKRQLLQRSPADRFFLMQSEHPATLPGVSIVFRPFSPMIPMPWKLEVPDMKPITGVILFWMDTNGLLTSEPVIGKPDLHAVFKRFKRLQTVARQQRARKK